MEPIIRREGNVRLVSQPLNAWPYAYEAAVAAVDGALEKAGQESAGAVSAYGPVQIMVSLPPDDPDPATWNLQIGRACLGIPAVRSPLLVEDYHNLVTCSLPHLGPVRDLSRAYRLAADFARSQGARTRPYWRVSLKHDATPDGQGILVTEVAVFIDR